MSQSNVIPKEDLTAWERWEMDSFTGVGRSANAMALPTAQQLEDIEHQARQEGLETGYREGAARAQAEAAKLAAMATALDRDLSRLDELLAGRVLSLALTVARSMLRTALDVKPELLLPALREAIAEIPAQSTHRRIQLHPDDAAIVRRHAPDLLQAGGWQLIEDAKIARGGCRLLTALGEVDATLPTRWQRVLAAIGRDGSWLDGAADGGDNADE